MEVLADHEIIMASVKYWDCSIGSSIRGALSMNLAHAKQIQVSFCCPSSGQNGQGHLSREDGVSFCDELAFWHSECPEHSRVDFEQQVFPFGCEHAHSSAPNRTMTPRKRGKGTINGM